MKLGTVKRTQIETSEDIHLHEVRLHFADDATPPEAGGPGALIVQMPGWHVAIPADDTVVTSLVAKIAAIASGTPKKA